jgi:ABC-type antimicrobial peptide transport system permease subunit
LAYSRVKVNRSRTAWTLLEIILSTALVTAVCAVSVRVPQSSADKVKFDIELRRYTGSAWTSVQSWSETVNVNYSYALFEKLKSVSSDYYYKFVGTVTVYKNNSVVESVNIDSATGYY